MGDRESDAGWIAGRQPPERRDRVERIVRVEANRARQDHLSELAAPHRTGGRRDLGAPIGFRPQR